MLEIQKLRMIAQASGFEKTKISEDGTVIWMSRSIGGSPDFRARICIDAVTQSATTFWSTDESSCQSKTFRSSEQMQAWLDES
jgi:hypothetical protein